MPPRGGPAAYLALAMHSKVTSLDPATTLLLPGGMTMTGAVVSGVPAPPMAEKAQVHGALLVWSARVGKGAQATLRGPLHVAPTPRGALRWGHCPRPLSDAQSPAGAPQPGTPSGHRRPWRGPGLCWQGCALSEGLADLALF